MHQELTIIQTVSLLPAANRVDPDQLLHEALSDRDLYILP
jgi:hypothetical protein